MSKVIRTQKPSVLPWYAAALVFAVLCAVLPVYKLWALLVALGCAGAAFGAAQKVCPPRVVEHEVPFHTGVGRPSAPRQRRSGRRPAPPAAPTAYTPAVPRTIPKRPVPLHKMAERWAFWCG